MPQVPIYRICNNLEGTVSVDLSGVNFNNGDVVLDFGLGEAVPGCCTASDGGEGCCAGDIEVTYETGRVGL